MQASAQGGVAGAGRTFERVSVVKALAGRKVPTSVAHAYSPTGAELVVVERYADPSMQSAIEENARAAMALRHPNVGTVRDVWREGTDLCVAMEYVEGETLEELRRVGAGGKELSIEVGVRVIVDVLAALSAIHTAGKGGAVHGEVTATNVIVGFDGTTRLIRPFHGAVVGKSAESDWFSYVAPEVVKGSAADVRADLYAVGVLLWETLSRRKLFPKATREGRAARSMPVGKPSAPTDASWAAPLGAVAERALANDPSARYTTAAEMAAAVRLAVRSKLAMPPRVSAAVDKLAGERILARRNALALPDPSGESNRVSMPGTLPGTRPSVPPEATRALAAIRPSSRPPPVAAKPAPPPVIPKSPPLPKLDAKPEPPKPPRPVAPPIAIAPPIPKPASIPPPPAEILDIALDSVREPPVVAPPPPTPTTTPTPAPAPIAQAAAIATPAPMPTPIEPAPASKRKGMIWIAVAVLFALVALAAVIRMVTGGSTETTTPVASASHSVKTPATATATASATTKATVTATATTSAAASATAPESSASAEPEPTSTATAPTDSSHRPHTRPRPTYDPMGI
jgi:serine/threonine protein kinase